MARVHVLSWQTTYSGLIPQSYIDQLTVERRTAFWTADLQREGANRGTFVACDAAGEVVGLAGCGPIRKSLGEYDGELYVIYLLQSAQGQGVGRGLFHAVATHLTALGLESMMLWVLKNNPTARGFYAAMGGLDLGVEQVHDVHGQQVSEVAYGWPSLKHLLERLER